MRLLLQRVSRASVTVNNEVVGEINRGLLLFLGLATSDTDASFPQAIDKVLNLRIFPDEKGVMNRSVRDVGGGILVVSQFTLQADARKGRRPSYINAMPPTEAEALYNRFLQEVTSAHEGPVAAGIFGAMMDVELVNDGPVTIWLDGEELGWKS
ncbi:MAG: D-tyrosyl-tRNA(Tyr) deacylase [Candidatus Sumerlaeia bacterium]|nr:D-tyrosyl-tRNA(Tyr) deacylase [Candidatus Sumerlaeia bacterium]